MMRALPFLLALAAPLAAHQYPITQATLSAVPGGVRLRLRLSLHHFHAALEAEVQHRIVLRDREEYAPADLERYFEGRLELRKDGTVVPFRVVAQDLDPKDLVVTLEAPCTDPAAWTLRHTVMFEVSGRQQNLVTVEGLGPRRGLTFDRRHAELPLGAP